MKIELMFSPKEINYLNRLLAKTHCDECLMSETKNCGKCPAYRTHCTVQQAEIITKQDMLKDVLTQESKHYIFSINLQNGHIVIGICHIKNIY